MRDFQVSGEDWRCRIEFVQADLTDETQIARHRLNKEMHAQRIADQQYQRANALSVALVGAEAQREHSELCQNRPQPKG